MDIGNENDPVFRLEQILDKKSGGRAYLLFHRGDNYFLYRATGLKVSCCVAFKEKPVPYRIEKLVLRFMENRLLDLKC